MSGIKNENFSPGARLKYISHQARIEKTKHLAEERA